MTSEVREVLPMLNVDQALGLIRETVSTAPRQTSPLLDALGSRLAEKIVCPEDSPPFDKSMMDGFAVRSSDLRIGEIEFLKVGELAAGHESALSIGPGQTIQIMTGAPIPKGADVVIPVEQSRELDGSRVRLTLESEVASGRNILRRGTNMRVDEDVIAAGQLIRPQEIALLAEMGLAHVSVYPKPSVAILATGDELVPVDATPGPGQIRNSNALMLAQQVNAAGAAAEILDIARDNREDLRAKIQQGLQADFLCLSGGVSAGKLDLVPSELERAGVRKVFHKVAMKPGKPIWFGKRETEPTSDCYVFGLPGNPVSSMVCFELFVRTALQKFSGSPNASPQLLEAELTKEFEQQGDRDVWFPSIVETDSAKLCVTPTNWKGSSDLRTTVLANCSACFPAGIRTFQRGETVQVLLWSGSRIEPKLTRNS